MEKIASFTVNHLDLLRGVYVSRVDRLPSGDTVTTYDIRMTEPNRQPALDGASLHTIEHLAATYLRNRADVADRVVYWGPMGCRTGNYLILAGAPDVVAAARLMLDTFRFIAGYEGEVPGATPHDCGNYSYMDLTQARDYARRFVDEILAPVVADPDSEESHRHLNYPPDEGH